MINNKISRLHLKANRNQLQYEAAPNNISSIDINTTTIPTPWTTCRITEKNSQRLQQQPPPPPPQQQQQNKKANI